MRVAWLKHTVSKVPHTYTNTHVARTAVSPTSFCLALSARGRWQPPIVLPNVQSLADCCTAASSKSAEAFEYVAANSTCAVYPYGASHTTHCIGAWSVWLHREIPFLHYLVLHALSRCVVMMISWVTHYAISDIMQQESTDICPFMETPFPWSMYIFVLLICCSWRMYLKDWLVFNPKSFIVSGTFLFTVAFIVLKDTTAEGFLLISRAV